MEWLSDALNLVNETPSRDGTPAPLTGSNPPPVMGVATSPSAPGEELQRPLQRPRPRPVRQTPGPRAKSSLGAKSSKADEAVSSSDHDDVAPVVAPPESTPPQPSPQASVHLAFGANSEFHPMPVPLAAIQQSGPESSPGSEPAAAQKSKRTRSFPTFGFRLVWNDAPNAAQDAKGTFGKYETVRTLGKGSFGTAVLLRHRRTGHMVVSKQVSTQEMPRVERSKVKREAGPTQSPRLQAWA